jgi:Rrf2 family protein
MVAFFMLRLSKKVEYALIAMMHMSSRGTNRLTTARELSLAYHIPSELMGKVLQNLSKKGLITSVQGIKGGYKLNKPLKSITLKEILQALEGPFKIVNCMNKKNETFCDQHLNCTIKNPMGIIQSRIEKMFDELNLQEIESELSGRYH